MSPQKIKIKSLQKPAEYINREWGTVLAQRHYLLASSDWTQLEDNELTFESRIRWNEWRKDVRAVRRRNFEHNMNDAVDRLKLLEANIPAHEFIQSTNIRQKKYQLDVSNLAVAKNDAMNIMKTLHHDWTITFIPENINLVNAKFEEAEHYLTQTPKPKSFKEYPLLEQTYKLYNLNRSQTVEEICRLKRTCTDIFLMIQAHQFKFTNQIQAATSTDAIIEIIKNMHGY